MARTDAASAPNLHETQEAREPLVAQHAEGQYHGTTATVGRYQNLGNTAHMVSKLARVSSSSAHTIDWQLNLRGGSHRMPDQWGKYFTRSHQSFDMMNEKTAELKALAKAAPKSSDSDDGQEQEKDRDRNAARRYRQQFEDANSDVTTERLLRYRREVSMNQRPDRNANAISITTCRDDPINLRRYPGCEGTQVGQWSHLLSDRRHGHKSRRQMMIDTTWREPPGDSSGGRVTDNRSDGCLVEMLGKKKWSDGYGTTWPSRTPSGTPRGTKRRSAWKSLEGDTHDKPFSQRPPVGDPKLHYLSRMKVLPEGDEATRALRQGKAKRHENEAPEVHTPPAPTPSMSKGPAA